MGGWVGKVCRWLCGWVGVDRYVGRYDESGNIEDPDHTFISVIKGSSCP